MKTVVSLLCLAALSFGREPVRARQAMVVAAEPIATDVGVAVLKSGGNAIDAAVAVAFALAVTYPYAGNIGGGGFLLYRDKTGKSTFIDFRERAPLSATRDMYLDAKGQPTRDSLIGWRSSGIPGTVAGLELAHKKYGRKPWKDLVAPAVALADKGFPLSYLNARMFRETRGLAADPESKRIFQRNGSFYSLGDTFVQKDFAKTLKRIQKKGPRDFYEGALAKALAAEMSKHGGLITLEDLKTYRAIEREPLRGTYKGHEVLTAPPPSAGGLGILQMLAMLDGSGYEKGGLGSASTTHYLTEVMKRYYADRAEFLGDPDFVKMPLAGLLSPAYIASRRSSIQMDRATPADQLGPGRPQGVERTETTHFSLADSEGNAVALTYTLNGGFGNGITVPGLGFLLNNEMDDFAVKPGVPNMFGALGGEANSIAPRKTPLSAMTPTIVAKDGKLAMILGAPGGTRITSSVLQVLVNVIDFGLNIQDAIDRPRLHHQWRPDKLQLESGYSPDTIAILRSWGHSVEPLPTTGVLPAIEGIMVEENTLGRWLAGAYDARRDGKAAGY